MPIKKKTMLFPLARSCLLLSLFLSCISEFKWELNKFLRIICSIETVAEHVCILLLFIIIYVVVVRFLCHLCYRYQFQLPRRNAITINGKLAIIWFRLCWIISSFTSSVIFARVTFLLAEFRWIWEENQKQAKALMVLTDASALRWDYFIFCLLGSETGYKIKFWQPNEKQ